MAGDGEKSLQATSVTSNLFEGISDQDIVNSLSQVLQGEQNASTWDTVAALLDSENTNLSLATQIKTEPVDSYANNSSCCGHTSEMFGSNEDLPFGSYPPATVGQLPLESTPVAMLPTTIKTEPTLDHQPICPGSRKSRKGKMVKPDEKKERRKAQNRKAAKNYREKQKSKKEQVECDYSRLISDNSEKENEIENLKHEVERLQNILAQHEKHGSCQIPSSVSQPSIPTTLLTQTPLPRANEVTSTMSRIPQPIDIPHFPLVPENEQAPQVPPYTPNSEQSFGFEANIYSPQSCDKPGGREQVYSPLDGQDFEVDFAPVSTDGAFKNLDNQLLVQQSSLLDVSQWHTALDYLR